MAAALARPRPRRRQSKLLSLGRGVSPGEADELGPDVCRVTFASTSSRASREPPSDPTALGCSSDGNRSHWSARAPGCNLPPSTTPTRAKHLFGAEALPLASEVCGNQRDGARIRADRQRQDSHDGRARDARIGSGGHQPQDGAPHICAGGQRFVAPLPHFTPSRAGVLRKDLRLAVKIRRWEGRRA